MAQIPLNSLLQSATNLNLGSQLQTAAMAAELQMNSMIGETAKQTAPTPAAAAAVEPLVQPTFSKAADSYGVMRHIDPVRDHFLNARVGIETLRRIALEGVGRERVALLALEQDRLPRELLHAFDVGAAGRGGR